MARVEVQASDPDSLARTLVVRAGAGPQRPLRAGRGSSESLVGGQVRAGRLDVRRLLIEAGSRSGPLHTHRSAENSYLVLEGVLEVRVGSDRHRLEVGDAIFIPPGIPHATHNPADRRTILLAIYDHPIDDDFELAVDDGTAAADR